MAKLPEGWVVADLGEFCEGIRGVTYKPDDLVQVNTEKTITLLRSNNINAGALNFKVVQHVAQKNVNQKQIAQLGDIAVCMSNGSKRLVGKSATFKYIPEGHRYTVGSFCSIFRPLKSACSVFVEQIFCSDQFQKQVDFSLAGSAINNLKNSDLIAYQFLKPPLPEQQKIATILSSVDDVIEKTRAQIDKLKDLKTGMMQELLTKGIGHTEFKHSQVGLIPLGWIPSSIRGLVKFSGGSQPTRDTFLFEPREGYVRLLQIRDYKSDRFATYIPEKLSKRWCGKNDIMIGRYGPPIFQIMRGKEGSYNVALIKATPKSDNLLKNYLYHFLCRKDLFHLIDSYSQRTSGQTGIDIDALNDFGFPLPPMDEQLKTAKILDELDGRIDLLHARLGHFIKLKKALMQDLLTGKVRVNLNESAAIENG